MASRTEGRTGTISVPSECAPLVEGVFGLDDRPAARPYIHQPDSSSPEPRPSGHWADEVADLYHFPPLANATGQCIVDYLQFGVVGTGGHRSQGVLRSAWACRAADHHRRIGRRGARNAPGDGSASAQDLEVTTMDVQIAGLAAPGAKVVVYFAPNSDQGYIGAVAHAIHDGENDPSVISISWGQSESFWTRQTMDAIDGLFQDAASLGLTICCSVGDQGSSDGDFTRGAHVDFPGSSPHALGCGGTRIEVDGAMIARETVWRSPNGGATGGGLSQHFAVPAWQARAIAGWRAKHHGVARGGRGVPDVAASADPAAGYNVMVDGKPVVCGGTSAAAPLWAALVARLNQSVGVKLGRLAPTLYGLPPTGCGFRDITSGSNDAYTASSGWNPCTGLGSPNPDALTQALSLHKAQTTTP